jgi:hypothetical protein
LIYCIIPLPLRPHLEAADLIFYVKKALKSFGIQQLKNTFANHFWIFF